METDVYSKVCREKMGVDSDTALDAAEAYEVLSWLDIEALDNAGADIEGLQPEELDLENIKDRKDRIEEDLQENREILEEIYAASWDRAMGEP